MDEYIRIKISKKMAYILRHKEGVTDPEGWVNLDRLVAELRRYFPWIKVEDVVYVVNKDEKGRYELDGHRIRARYGHTVNVNIRLPKSHESTLYHGTTCEAAKTIMREGIKPMKRKKVHLTSNIKEAIENALRKGKCITLLEIDVECLRKKGFETYEAGRYVRVTNYVPPECIRSVKKIQG